MLSDCLGIATRGTGERDSTRCQVIQVDMIGAGSGSTDKPQRNPIQQLFIDPRNRAHQQHVCASELFASEIATRERIDRAVVGKRRRTACDFFVEKDL